MILAFKGGVLKGWRLEKKLSQSDAAMLLSITQAFYCHLEVGRKAPSLDTLETISIRTGIPISELVGGANPPQPLTGKKASRTRAQKGASVGV